MRARLPGTLGPSHPNPIEAMTATASKPLAENITPPVHLEFIQNQLEGSGPASLEEIEHYHRALFLHHHALEWETWRQQAKTQQERLAFLEGRLKAAELDLSQRTQLVPVSVDGQEDTRPNAPWNAWDMAMFAFATVAIIGLIAFGVLNISFNLLESGFVTFRDNPFRSYLWAALLPVGALAVKIGWDLLESRRRRDIYLWTCLSLGILGVVVWVAAYACVYPTLSKGINEQIASMSVFDTQSSGAASRLNFAGAKWVDVTTVAGQAIAEIFLSAVLGMYLTSLYARHRPVRLAPDPAFTQLDEQRRDLNENIRRERVGLGEANGNLARLENQLAALIAFSKSMFHREAARRQDQSLKRQVILDQLSDNLRHHLEDHEPANRLATSAAGAGSARTNGA
jgi:hypothetical protein